MNLTSDLPFWTVKNGLLRVYPPIDCDLRCDALVVGGGISGALLARQLTRRGVDCIIIDRRDIGFGSTSASTALLQYEIDTPLHILQRRVGRFAAERAYRAGLESIGRLQKLAGANCDFALRPSFQVATQAAHIPGLKAEYELRRELRFPVTWLNPKELRDSGITAKGALCSHVAGEVDPYRLTHRLLRMAAAGGLRTFDRTTAVSYEHARSHVTVTTDRGCKIRCRNICFATGYETQDILPDKIVSFRSTYAFISEPIADPVWWKDRSLIWGTGDPYIYMRTAGRDRILVGGEDDNILEHARRDHQLSRKTKILLRRFNTLFPSIHIEPAFSWAGLFGSTKDGLAYIGPNSAFPRAFFALGFGGNGITFAEIASRIVTDLVTGRKNPDAEVFRFDR